jgi:hypothetical protein
MSRALRHAYGWVGAVLLLFGFVGVSVLTTGQPAGAATTGLTGVTLTTNPTAAGTYKLTFTVHQTFGTPALLAVAVPGATFPTTPSGKALTCTPACTGGLLSVWGSTGSLTPAQTGASSIVYNLGATANFSGKFAAGQTISAVIPLTAPTTPGNVPVSVAVESAPGQVLASGTGTLTIAGTPAIGPLAVAPVTVTPNSVGYPHAAWTATVSGLHQVSAPAGRTTLYVPGATFPASASAYTVSTCTFTAAGTVTTQSTCAGTATTTAKITVVTGAGGTSGQPGTAAVLGVVTSVATTHFLTGFKVAVAGVTNTAGPGATQPLLAGSGTTLTALAATGTSAPVALVSSPTIGLTSTHDPNFPSQVTVGSTANFGLNIADMTNFTWPANGAAVVFTLSGITGLLPGAVNLQCAYEGTPPAGFPTTSMFTFSAKGSTLVSNANPVPLTKTTTLQLDCALGLSGSTPIGTLTVAAALDDTTTSTPFTLASASNHLSVLPIPTTGYTMVASDGGIFTYGTDQFYGSMGGKPLNQPIVGMAKTPDGKGYWEVASDGGIFSFGDAQFYGSMGGKPLNQPIVGMASTPDGKGYWEVASDGGIFSFGDAQFSGSAGSLTLRAPVVGMATTNDGKGYWLVASDGGIFTYGDGNFFGSAGALRLKAPVVGMAATSSGAGYWEVASDGGIFTFGNASFYGSAGALTLNKPVVGMKVTSDNGGYWLAASDGGIFSYGDAPFEGSAGSLTLNKPVVGIS